MNLQKISLDVNGQLFSHLAISTILSLIKVHDDRCEVST